MIELIDHLESSGKAQYLFAFTSMFDLIISQTQPKHPDMPPHLRISPRRDAKLEFRYFDSRDPGHGVCRIVASDEAVARIEKFFDQLRWFGGEVRK
jgi:hypothetical protein